MKAETLREMLKRTIRQYGHPLHITYQQIDYILDLCDDNYEEELNKVIEAQKRVNEVFIKALGRIKFDEIRNEIQA